MEGRREGKIAIRRIAQGKPGDIEVDRTVKGKILKDEKEGQGTGLKRRRKSVTSGLRHALHDRLGRSDR